MLSRLLLILAIAVPLRVSAERAQPMQGWPDGVVLSGSPADYSSPAAFDLDGDPSNGLEIVQATGDGVVHAIGSDGTVLWDSEIPNVGCVGPVGNRVHSSPAVGKVNGKDASVVIGFGAVIYRSCDGGVVSFDGKTGAVSWLFSLKNFSKQNHFWAFRYSVYSTPSLFDVDHDGKLEVGFGAFDRNLYLLNSTGKDRWYYQAADTIWSSPAFADINRDGFAQMIAATDISANNHLDPPSPDGGYIYGFKTAPRPDKAIGFRNPTAAWWRNETDQTLYSSPAIGEVLSSNPGPEAVIASGCFFPQNGTKRGRWIKMFSAMTGKLLRTYSIPTCSASSVALGDIDGDGVNEIVAYVQGSTQFGGDGLSRVYAWKGTSSTPLWVTIPEHNGHNNAVGGEFSNPVLADLDGNGSLEVIVGNGSGISILNGIDGRQLTCADKNCDKPILEIGGTIRATPLVADINGDGQLDLIAVGTHHIQRDHLGVYAWSNFKDWLGSTPGKLKPYSAPWSAWRGNSQRTGSLPGSWDRKGKVTSAKTKASRQ